MKKIEQGGESIQDSPDETTNQLVIRKSPQRIIYRSFTVSAVAIEPFYSYFLWISVCQAVEFMLQEVEVYPNNLGKKLISTISAPFVFGNLISDMTSVDALRDADEFIFLSQSKKRELSKRILGNLLTIIAFLTSFPVGSSGDSISIAALTEKIKDPLVQNIINYIGLFIVVALGIIYYMMFTNAEIQKHANEFIDAMKKPRAFIRSFINNPGILLEIAIQSFFNSAYRGIVFGYMLSDVLATIFKINNKNKGSRVPVLITVISTFIITLFSRTLSVRNYFLNPDYLLVTEDEYKKAKQLNSAMVADILLTIIRATSLSVLIFFLLPASIFLKYFVAASFGIVMTIHSGYVRLTATIFKNALGIISSAELDPRRRELRESTALISTVEVKNDAELLIENFETLSSKFDSKNMQSTINFVNIMARTARFVGFFLFLATLNNVFNFGLNTVCIVALSFLWGTEVFKSDGALFSQFLRANWSGIAAKTYLETIKYEKESNGNIVQGWPRFRVAFFGTVKALAKSPFDYDLSAVQEAIELSGENKWSLSSGK